MTNPTTAKLRIFILEDHEDTLEYFQMYLEQMGHEVVAARTFQEAVDLLPSSGCNMLITDVGLPDGSGWEILDRLNLPEPIYAVALSGYGMTVDKLKSLAAGFRHHLVKPPSMEVLEKVLDEAARELAMR